MGCVLVVKEKVLRGVREAPGFFKLGPLAGHALAVRPGILHQTERARRKTKLVLWNRKASA